MDSDVLRDLPAGRGRGGGGKRPTGGRGSRWRRSWDVETGCPDDGTVYEVRGQDQGWPVALPQGKGEEGPSGGLGKRLGRSWVSLGRGSRGRGGCRGRDPPPTTPSEGGPMSWKFLTKSSLN